MSNDTTFKPPSMADLTIPIMQDAFVYVHRILATWGDLQNAVITVLIFKFRRTLYDGVFCAAVPSFGLFCDCGLDIMDQATIDAETIPRIRAAIQGTSDPDSMILAPDVVFNFWRWVDPLQQQYGLDKQKQQARDTRVSMQQAELDAIPSRIVNFRPLSVI